MKLLQPIGEIMKKQIRSEGTYQTNGYSKLELKLVNGFTFIKMEIFKMKVIIFLES